MCSYSTGTFSLSFPGAPVHDTIQEGATPDKENGKQTTFFVEERLIRKPNGLKSSNAGAIKRRGCSLKQMRYVWRVHLWGRWHSQGLRLRPETVMHQRCLALGCTGSKILLVLLWVGMVASEGDYSRVHWHEKGQSSGTPQSHSCIHDRILEQQRRFGVNQYKITPQVYKEQVEVNVEDLHSRRLLSLPIRADAELDKHQSIRIFLNYDAVGHSMDRDCHFVHDIVKLGEPASSGILGFPACNSHSEPPLYGDCWYNCTEDDISGEDKKTRLHEALGETAAWFRRALSVEQIKGPLRLSGYSACGQDGGVQLPRQYVEEGVEDADLVLLVTTRPTTGNTLAWAVACERDQWGRAIAGHVNVAPRHLIAEAESLLSATLIHEVMHVLGFDPHAFAHFRDEQKRRRSEVVQQVHDPKLGRMVTRVVLPRVIMHSRQHYGAYHNEFPGLELEDGGGRGTAGSHWEKRLLMNEIMTGSVDTRSVVSAMTLALLEDSGWYKVNYSMAEQLDWGQNQGMEFLVSRCDAWNGAYHCNSSHASGCTYNREAEGYCPIVRYNGDLPVWARYFPEANRGGQSSLADYCAYFVAYSDGSCIDTNSARSPDRMLGETRGRDSRCMASSLVRAGFVRGSSTQGNGCYEHRCINQTLEVAVDGVWQTCPIDGGPIQFNGFNGDLVCPPHYELCDMTLAYIPGECPHACYLNGECVNGVCHCFLGFSGEYCNQRVCPSGCSGHGTCTVNGVCECESGYTGVDCSTAGCDEQCSLHGGVCDNGLCEFRCSDYAGYTCQNSSALIPSLALCGDVLAGEAWGQHCAPSEPSILQQLEAAVVMPNYNRLIPSGRPFFSMFDNGYCSAAAKRLACWISIQRCDMDGDNRLRVCHSACQSYNKACGARLDCSDRTLFSGEEGCGLGTCTGDGTVQAWWQIHLRTLLLAGLLVAVTGFFLAAIRHICWTFQTSGRGVMGDGIPDMHGPYVVLSEGEFEGGWGGTGRRKPVGNFGIFPLGLLVASFMHKASRLPSGRPSSDVLLMHTRQLHPRGSPRGMDSMAEEGN